MVEIAHLQLSRVVFDVSRYDVIRYVPPVWIVFITQIEETLTETGLCELEPNLLDDLIVHTPWNVLRIHSVI